MKKRENKKVFYETMYASGKAPNIAKPGLIDILYGRLGKFALHREDAVARLVPGGERLLDIGCGNGSFLFKVKDRFRELHGVDIAANRIAEANTRKSHLENGGAMHFLTADIDEGLPYEDGSFDCVTTIAAFEHMFDPYAAIAEIRRVLKPGGTFIVEVPNIAWLPRRLGFLIGELPRTSNEAGWDGGHLHYFTVKELKNFLGEQGFTVLGVSGAGILSSIRSHWVSLLSGDIIMKAQKIERINGMT